MPATCTTTLAGLVGVCWYRIYLKCLLRLVLISSTGLLRLEQSYWRVSSVAMVSQAWNESRLVFSLPPSPKWIANKIANSSFPATYSRNTPAGLVTTGCVPYLQALTPELAHPHRRNGIEAGVLAVKKHCLPSTQQKIIHTATGRVQDHTALANAVTALPLYYLYTGSQASLIVRLILRV